MSYSDFLQLEVASLSCELELRVGAASSNFELQLRFGVEKVQFSVALANCSCSFRELQVLTSELELRVAIKKKIGFNRTGSHKLLDYCSTGLSVCLNTPLGDTLFGGELLGSKVKPWVGGLLSIGIKNITVENFSPTS